MNIYFLSNIGPRLACMRTSGKTSARLKITVVDMTYPKGWTGCLPLCPLFSSCRNPGQNLDIVRLHNGSKKLVLMARNFTGISVSVCDWLESYPLCDLSFTHSTNQAILLIKSWNESSKPWKISFKFEQENSQLEFLVCGNIFVNVKIRKPWTLEIFLKSFMKKPI